MNKIEFPIEVSEIKVSELHSDPHKPSPDCGRYVKVRPCGEKYKDKTYLGILLGDLPLSTHAYYNKKDKKIEVMFMHNPAIYVPDLKEIVWGCESWWGRINKEEDLKDITDADINDVWYVKALKELAQKPKE